jgi:hypothetical protein
MKRIGLEILGIAGIIIALFAFRSLTKRKLE